MKNKLRGIAISFLLIVFFSSSLSSYSAAVAYSPITSFGNSSAVNPCSNAISESLSDPSVYSSPAAINLALNSPELKSATAGSTLEFNSIFHLLTNSLTAGTCTLSLQSVNVVFGMSNGSLAVVSENPTSTQVIGVSLQTPHYKFGLNSNTWTGYEYHNSTGTTDASWTQPSAASQCPQFTQCIAAFWVGQTALKGGGASGDTKEGIDQAGSVANVSRGYCCTVTSYYAWYEFFPAYPVNCFGISSGDTIYAGAYYSGGYNWAYAEDGTNNNVCTTSSQMAMGSPSYSQFIAEEPSGSDTAPDFNSMTFTSSEIGGTGIYSLSADNYYSSTADMSSGSVSSSSSFTVTYTGSL